MSTARISARRSKRLARRATEDESVGRDEHTVWLSRTEASQIAPGLTPEKLADLRRRGVGAPTWTLSDRADLYDELLFRRWLESTVDDRWVNGLFGAHRPTPSRERAYTYGDACLDELRRRTYISPSQLLSLLPGLSSWQMNELRQSGTGPRYLTPTPHTIVYVAEEALWWSETVPDYRPSRERGLNRDGTHRELLTPPVTIRRSLTPVEEARIRDAQDS